jgi:hypothetical protein
MKYLLLLSSLFILVACTSKVSQITDTNLDSLRLASCKGEACSTCPLPWGGVLLGNQIMQANFSKELVECNESCSTYQVSITCQAGKIFLVDSAGKTAATPYLDNLVQSCSKKNCGCKIDNINGQYNPITIADGDPITLYSSSSMPCGQLCQSRKMRCVGGQMVDSQNSNISALPWLATYQYTTCSTVACRPCQIPCSIPGVSLLGNGSSATCYSAVTPSKCGDNCNSYAKNMYCNDGTLTDDTGLSIGTLSGQSTQIWNTFSKYCENTTTNVASCKLCTMPDGSSVGDGTTVMFFKFNLAPSGESCYSSTNSVQLTCNDGQFANRLLYPAFIYSSCKSNTGTMVGTDLGVGRIAGDGGGAPRWFCRLPWSGAAVTPFTKVVAYDRMTVDIAANTNDNCTNHKMLITCSNAKGIWTGGAKYIYPTCYELDSQQKIDADAAAKAMVPAANPNPSPTP